jgi:hypothetical protein
MILNKVIFGIFLFFVLYYFSDRKNIYWCLYGVIIYILLLIAIEYLNNNKEIKINQHIESNLNSLKNKSHQYLSEQRNLITENFQNNIKLLKQESINNLPNVKYDKLKPSLPNPYNIVEHKEKQIDDDDRGNINKLDILNKKGIILNKYMKPKMDNIEVYNLDHNYGLVLDDAEAYQFNVNNQLFYSMNGGENQ